MIGKQYHAIITNFIWPELNDMNVEKLWGKQDGTTCNTAISTMAVLNEKLQMASSCETGKSMGSLIVDLMPLNFFHWGYPKSKIYGNTPATIQQLKHEIKWNINEM